VSKILFFSDLHAHNHAQFATRRPNGLNSRFADCLAVVDQITDYCKAQQIQHVVFLGDLFHSRTKLDIDVFTLTWETMKRLAKQVGDLRLLVGNHDQFTRIGDVHAIRPFEEFAQVIDQPTLATVGDCPVYFIPFTANEDKLKEIVHTIPYNAKLVCLHQPVREAIPGPTNSPGKPDFTVEDFPLDRLELVLSGDIHKQQWVGGKEKMFYVGSPMQHNFGEREHAKSFVVLDTEMWKLELVPTVAPTFHYFECGEASDPAALAFEHCDPDRDFIKVVYADCWRNNAEAVKDKHPRVHILQSAAPTAVDLAPVPGHVFLDDRSLLEAYMTQNAYGKLDPARLLDVGLDYLDLVR
jgi:DNA repair exonuclease SbcCD nuclease subunit